MAYTSEPYVHPAWFQTILRKRIPGIFDLLLWLHVSDATARIISHTVSLLMGFVCQIGAGVVYGFSLYGPRLSESLHLNLFETVLLGTAQDVGGGLSAHIGWFYDVLGVWPSAIVAAVLSGASFTLLATASTDIPAAIGLTGVYGFLFFLIIMFFLGRGTHFLYVLSLMSNSKNFRLPHRGKVVGSQVAFFGLGGLVFVGPFFMTDAFLRYAWHVESQWVLPIYIFVYGIFLVAIAITAGFFVQVVPPLGEEADVWSSEELAETLLPADEKPRHKYPELLGREDPKKNYSYNRNSMVDEQHGGGSGESDDYYHTNPNTHPAMDGLRMDTHDHEHEHDQRGGTDVQSSSSSSEKEHHRETEEEIAVADADLEVVPAVLTASGWKAKNVRGKAVFISPAFWLLAGVNFLVIGAGYGIINNAGALVLALGGDLVWQAVAVASISLGSFSGRLTSGVLSDFTAKWTVRAHYLVLASLLMALALLLLTVSPLYVVPLPLLMVGFAFGSTLSASPAATADLYGLIHFGENWGWLGISRVFGSLTFGPLAGLLYDIEARDSPDGRCYGYQCFLVSLLIGAFAAIASSVLAVLLTTIMLTERKNEKIRREAYEEAKWVLADVEDATLYPSQAESEILNSNNVAVNDEA
jgi:MFS family permease